MGHLPTLFSFPLNIAEIAEAYEVLVDPKYRAIYDRYGEAGLKGKAPPGSGPLPVFTPSNPTHVYEQFFGTANPHAVSLIPDKEQLENPPPSLVDSMPPPPTTRPLEITLEELYTGTSKKVSIPRTVMGKDGNPHAQTERILTVPIKRGWESGTQLAFKGEGDSGGTLVLILQEIKHPLFEREGNTLYFQANITLEQALTGCTVEIRTLDGRLLRIPVNDIVDPHYTKVVKGEGMPDPATGTPGDLVLKFDLKFPKRLTDKQKQLLKEAFAAGPKTQ